MKAHTDRKWRSQDARNKAKGVAGMYQDFRNEAAAQVAEQDDPQRTVREARARQLSKPESEVMLEMLCFDAGRAINAGAAKKDEAKRMWETFTKFDQAHRASVFHSTGKPREPVVSRMEFMPERFEVRHDLPPIDLRSEQERHDAAMKRWRECRAVLGLLGRWERHSITDAFYQSTALYDGGITVSGQTFVAAMRSLCAAVDTYEGRR